MSHFLAAYFLVKDIDTYSERQKKIRAVPNSFFNEHDIYKINNWIILAKEIIIDFMNPDHGYLRPPIDYKRDPIYDKKRYKFISKDVFDRLFLPLFQLYGTIFEKKWQNDEIPQKIAINEFFYLEQDAVFGQKVIINDVNSRIFFIGDVHSSLHSLIQILNKIKVVKGFIGDSFKLKNNFYIFFLGDLVDRGPYSVEVITLAFILKIKNPENVFIINGNHEDPETFAEYGFESEYNKQIEDDMSFINTTLHFLPSVIFLKFCNKWYHLSHGAIPEFDTNGKSEAKKIGKFLKSDNEYLLFNEHKPVHSLKWGDFSGESFDFDIYTDFKPTNTNEGSYDYNGGRALFGPEAVKLYLNYTNIECIISGHQDTRSLLILSENNNGSSININESLYYKDNENHNLWGIGTTVSEHIRLLYPKKDFLALTTSTATISKQVSNTCFLVLAINKLRELIINCNQ